MMTIVNTDKSIIWRNLLDEAQRKCQASLPDVLFYYVASLLERYVDHPEIAERILAEAYLQANHLRQYERQLSLQMLGDECLLYAGFFPQQTQKKHVAINYFIQLGQSAYLMISRCKKDLYDELASQFVLLTDILQTARGEPNLLPLEAYERWQHTGSERARQMLFLYTKANSYFPRVK